MKQSWGMPINLVVLLLVSTLGCGAPAGTSLSGEELQKKYPDEKYVQLNGVSLHYKQEGLGRPVVLLHGFLTHSALWRQIVPAFTYGYTLYSLDLMGSGISEKPQNQTYSIDTHVAQLGKLIEEFHLDNTILVGHGVGAAIAMVYTVRNPGKVRKLVVMNAPLSSGYSATGLWLMKLPLVGGMLTSDWFIQRTLRGGFFKPTSLQDSVLDMYMQPFRDDPGARAALLKQVTELNLDAVVEKEVTPNLANLQVPTLILWGANDPYVPLDVGKSLDTAMPNDEFPVILNTGHYELEERPEEVRAVIKEFLDKN
jgi:pimeloyl-ACP methyl ester carboxylesterase